MEAKKLALKRVKRGGIGFTGVKIPESIDFTGLTPIWQAVGLTLPWDIQRESYEKITFLTMEYEDELRGKECVIDELKNKLAHAEALLGRDSTNTSLPTGQTPPYGINEMTALSRLCAGNLFTVEEILSRG